MRKDTLQLYVGDKESGTIEIVGRGASMYLWVGDGARKLIGHSGSTKELKQWLRTAQQERCRRIKERP